jgi:antitoxin ParD1/3/4
MAEHGQLSAAALERGGEGADRDGKRGSGSERFVGCGVDNFRQFTCPISLRKEARMPTMNVNLTPKMAGFVTSLLESGDYASASELVRDALRILHRDRDFEAEKEEILRRSLDLALEQADRREFINRSAVEIAAEVLAEDKDEVQSNPSRWR